MRFPPIASLLTALFALAASLTSAPASAFDISGAVQSVLPKTLDSVEKISSWKDAAPEEMRLEQCKKEGGHWVRKLKISACDNATARIDADGLITSQPCGAGHHEGELELQCTHRDALGHIYFNDGPSVPPAMLTISSWVHDSINQMHYNELFWPAGVLHDHCYHGNPVTYGLSQYDCDERFIEDLLSTCLFYRDAGFDWFKRDVCHTYATLMYGMVREHGNESFEGFNLEAHYEQPEPLYKQYGLDASPYTDACRQDVHDMLVKFKVMSEKNKFGDDMSDHADSAQ